MFLCACAATAFLVSTPSNVAAGALPAGGANDETRQALAAVRAAEARRIEVFAHAAKAVVCVFSDDQRGGGGSGVIIDPEGYGLTNFHVVQPFVESRRGFGGLSDGRLYPLKVLGIDPGGDIALFKLEGRQRFDYAPLGDSNALRVGQRVAAMGNPFDLAEDFSPTLTLGIISGLHRYQKGRGNLLEYADCIQVSTSINPGNSGGPLFDLDGRVIGINGRASFEHEEHRQRVNVGLGYAVSINQVKRFIPGLRAGRLLEHGTLGATVRGAGRELIVGAVQPFSAAERAGVQLGDTLVELAGRRVRTANDYNNVLATLPANWPVTLKLHRDGRPIEITARLDRLPLRMPLLYLVNLEHNHRELARILERSAQHMGTRVPTLFTHVVFRARVRSGPNGAGRALALVVSSDAGPSPEGDAQPEPDDARDPGLRDEWQKLALPLLARPRIDLQWELLAGDEVDGRIANVVERRLDSGWHIRWKFDWQTSELLQVTITRGIAAELPPGRSEPRSISERESEPRAVSERNAPAGLPPNRPDDQQPVSVVWRPASLEQFGELSWPRKWTRRSQGGEETVIEIESVEPMPVMPDETRVDRSGEEAAG